MYAAVDEDTTNEVHSVLGTEFADLSPTLEAHYAEYFDRGLVIDAYQRTLGDREDEIRALKASIADMEVRLDHLQAELDAPTRWATSRATTPTWPASTPS